MTASRALLVATLALLSCKGPTQGPFCQQYHGCVVSNQLGYAVEAYGPLGVCWQKGNKEAEACEQECSDALTELNDICFGFAPAEPDTDADTDSDTDTDTDTDTDSDTDTDTDTDTDSDTDTDTDSTGDTGPIVYAVSGTIRFSSAKSVVPCQIGLVDPNAVAVPPSTSDAASVPVAATTTAIGSINPAPFSFDKLDAFAFTGVYIVATCDADASGTYDASDPSGVVGATTASLLEVPSSGHTLVVD